LTNSHKQGGAAAFGEGHDNITGETCISASLNTNNLGDSAVLLFPVCGRGCAYLGLQMKAIKMHLALLTSSSHMLFIICSSYWMLPGARLVSLSKWGYFVSKCPLVGFLGMALH
jgi:hypothetical protein